MNVPFLDLVAHHRPFRADLIASFSEILESAAFVNGSRVRSFEEAFAEAHDVEHAVAVGNGTVALEIALRSLGIGNGNRVIVPANTFIASAEAVSNVGATPVLVDCDNTTWNISVPAAAEALEAQPIDAVIAVHLYGQPAPIDDLLAVIEPYGIPLVEDAAQAHLAEYRGRKVGGLGAIAGFSFYPGKNLGAVGEGGAVTTNDPELAEMARSYRDHGQIEKYRSGVIGTNGRMSELVGAGLGLELGHLDAWTTRRREVAERYNEQLSSIPGLQLPTEPSDVRSVYHLYVVHAEDRDQIQSHLSEAGIGTGLHYPIPIHLQAAYSSLGLGVGSFPNAEWSAQRLLSLPMFPELTDEQVDYVCDTVRDAVGTA